MIDPGPTTLGLDIATASVSAEPGLASADPAMMAAAARTFGSAAHQIEGAGRASSQASAQLSTNWWGRGKQGFDSAASKANSGAQVAAGAMAGAGGALMTLSVEISAAQAMAKQAQTLAADSTQAASALESAYAASAAQAVQALPPGATPAQVLAARAPSAAQAAQASAISADAAEATKLMAQANSMARQAWSQAAATFDAVTAQAPSVQAAVAAARAQAANAHQGGGFWSGVGNLALGGVAWAGDAVLGGVDALQGGVDPITDGATVLDGAEAADLTGTGIADITGGATSSEVAAAEEEAAANVVVDGTKVDSRVADDATEDLRGVDRGDGRDFQGKFANGAGGQGKDAEAQGLRQYEADTGDPVITQQVEARIPNLPGRRYDGLVENPDGTYTGIEVKSGSAIARYSGSQQQVFDQAVDSGTPATARLNGRTIKITATYLVKVPVP